MKVITEERFIKLLQSGNIKLINSCEVFEEIDTLTVLNLRPMSEEPEVRVNKMSAYVLLYSINMSVPRICRFDLHNGFDSDARKSGIGWLHLPIYKPEKE